MKALLLRFALNFCCLAAFSQTGTPAKIVPVGLGWAKNSVNTVVFRKNSLVTFRDTQYIAYYNNDGFIVLGKRTLGSAQWNLVTTACKGDVTDAHKCIAIMVDGDNYLHLAWGMHGNPLNYAKGLSPGSLNLIPKLAMTGKKELKVTYPEFYKLPNGNLLFLYRDGASGNGNLMLNRYDIKTKTWSQVRDGLIDGEGHRNAYWQMALDGKGTIHLSWVWRESPDVASNHDMCYACSKDGGISWQKSTGESYQLPITLATAEHAAEIPQKSGLINQTSMSINADGEPFIATYFIPQGATVSQYMVIYHESGQWHMAQVSKRQTPFLLGGGGTKKIPYSRPQIMVTGRGKHTKAIMIFRDGERGDKVSIAQTDNVIQNRWTISDLSSEALDSWEPSYDTELWKNKGLLNIFVQKTGQGDGEKLDDLAPQRVSVLEWKP